MKKLAAVLFLLLILTATVGCTKKDNENKDTQAVSDTNIGDNMQTSTPTTETSNTPETEATPFDKKVNLSLDGKDISEFTIVSKSTKAAERLNSNLENNGICPALPVTSTFTEGKPSIVIEENGFVSDTFSLSIENGNIYLRGSFNIIFDAADYFCKNFIKSFKSDTIELNSSDNYSETVPMSAGYINKSVMNTAIYHRGNTSRLTNILDSAVKGGNVITVAAIGGSITAGSGANSSESGYAKRFFNTITEQLGIKADFVNAGIGATGSAIGAYRLQSDVLDKNPDIVIVEFSVNDADQHVGFSNKEAYENIIRDCLSNGCAVIALCLPQGASGSNLRDGAQNDHKEIGKYYDIPVISITDALRQDFVDGTFVWQDFSNDTVHPNEEGHKLIGTVITDFVRSTYSADKTAEQELPAPLTSDIFSGAVWYNNEDIRPSDYGSFDEVEDPGFYQFKNNWLSEGGEDAEPMVFKLKDCKTAAIMYLVTPTGKGFANGKAVVEVDGKTTEFELKADRETWGSWASPVLAFRSEDGNTHDVTITIHPGDGKLSILRIGQS